MAARIVQVASRPECTPAEIADLAATDPGFAMRLLAATNASAHALRHRVVDVRHAASLFGVRGLRNLALSLVVGDLAPPGPLGTIVLSHCVRRAAAARAIGLALGISPEECFTAGLLLESGLLGLADADLGLEVVQTAAPLRTLRERLSGLPPHPQRGAELAVALGLPEVIAQAIEHHHAEAPPADPVARACWLAERVAALYEGGNPARLRESAESGAAAIGLDMTALDEIARGLPARVAEQAECFQRDLGEQPDLDALMGDVQRALVDMNREYEHLVGALERLLCEKERLSVELAESNARLNRLAHTDALTGLANRRALEAALTRDLAQAERQNTWLSIVAVDLDHFKALNDHYGHAAGDEALRLVAETLEKSVRICDLVARTGGEEMLVLLPNTDPPGARIVADRLRAALAAIEVPTSKGAVKLTASLGVASIRGPGTGRAAASLMARADAALYAAKRAGRNRVVIAPL